MGNIEARKLTDENLLLETKTLVQQERRLLIQILNYLKEIDRRKLFLQKGYPSLWAFMTTELGYSEAAAQRRIEAMRAIRELPVLEKKLESGALSISNLAKAQSTIRRIEKQMRISSEACFLATDIAEEAGSNRTTVADRVSKDISSGAKNISPEHKLEIFTQLENKSQKQAERILAEKFPEAAQAKETIRHLDGDKIELHLTIDKATLAQLGRAKELLSHKLPNPSMAEVVKALADFAVAKKDLSKSDLSRKDFVKNVSLERGVARKDQAKKDPAKKNQVKNDQTKKSVAKKDLVKNDREVSVLDVPKNLSSKRKSIPTKVRREVWRKAKGCCEYQDRKTDLRCGGRYQLEVDHIRPLAYGGKDEIENLRLLCRAHNQHVAREANLMP